MLEPEGGRFRELHHLRDNRQHSRQLHRPAEHACAARATGLEGDDVGTRAIEALMDHLADKGYATRTLSLTLSPLRRILTFGQRRRLLERNVADLVQLCSFRESAAMPMRTPPAKVAPAARGRPEDRRASEPWGPRGPSSRVMQFHLLRCRERTTRRSRPEVARELGTGCPVPSSRSPQSTVSVRRRPRSP